MAYTATSKRLGEKEKPKKEREEEECLCPGAGHIYAPQSQAEKLDLQQQQFGIFFKPETKPEMYTKECFSLYIILLIKHFLFVRL
jgi:hypothetical protein